MWILSEVAEAEEFKAKFKPGNGWASYKVWLADFQCQYEALDKRARKFVNGTQLMDAATEQFVPHQLKCGSWSNGIVNARWKKVKKNEAFMRYAKKVKKWAVYAVCKNQPKSTKNQPKSTEIDQNAAEIDHF